MRAGTCAVRQSARATPPVRLARSSRRRTTIPLSLWKSRSRCRRMRFVLRPLNRSFKIIFGVADEGRVTRATEGLRRKPILENRDHGTRVKG